MANAAGYDVNQVAYLGSGALCIGAIACLSSQQTARLGNNLGILGVGTGLVATGGDIYGNLSASSAAQLVATMGAGGAGGVYIANSIAVTDLPQLVAAFHSFVGLAAMLTCGAQYLADPFHFATDPSGPMHKTAIWAGSPEPASHPVQHALRQQHQESS